MVAMLKFLAVVSAETHCTRTAERMVGVTLEVRTPDDRDDDRHSIHSIASTVATTTSLASRIRDLNLFDEVDKDVDKDGDRTVHSPLPEDPEEERAETSGTAVDEESTSRAGALSEEDLSISQSLHLLHRDPPLQVCCRLFERRSHPPLQLKRMSMLQVEDFRQHGYVVIDNLISKEAAVRIKAEALRLSQQGQLHPVSTANMGILLHPSGGSGMPMLHQHHNHHHFNTITSSSPCSTCSSHSQHAAAAAPAVCSSNSSTSAVLHQQQQQQLQQQTGNQQQQQRMGELRLPLALGHPPADTAVFAPVMAALQELQDDLSEFVRLRGKGAADYCLCQLPAGSAAVPRHRDALPDDGRSSSSTTSQQQQSQQQPNGIQDCCPAAEGQPAAAADARSTPQQQQQQQQIPSSRRVSIVVFLNADWEKDQGGCLRLWPPQRPVGPSSTAAASAAARRSPTSSDAGTTFSEISDCGSLRIPWLGSTTSSVVAEPSAPDHDTYSLDGLSVAESEAERQGFEWVECDGGEMALDIAPLSGRVLIALSGAVDHALLPSRGHGPAAEMVFLRAWCG